MNTTETTKEVVSSARSVVGKIYEVGTGWVAMGVGFGRSTLKQSAHTLETGAQILDSVVTKLTKKDAAVEKPSDEPKV